MTTYRKIHKNMDCPLCGKALIENELADRVACSNLNCKFNEGEAMSQLLNKLDTDMENQSFKMEYKCNFRKEDNISLNPTEMCLLHLFKATRERCLWIHNKIRENPNENLEFLNYVIGEVCRELKIDSDKIFEVSPMGKLRPGQFERHIDIDDIPIMFSKEYRKVNDIYSELSTKLRKQQEDRKKELEKDLNFSYFSYKL